MSLLRNFRRLYDCWKYFCLQELNVFELTGSWECKILENEVKTNGSQTQEETHADHGISTGRRLLEDKDPKESQQGGSESTGGSKEDVPSANLQNEEALEADADASFDLLRDSDELADEYSYDYDDYVDESMWGDEAWSEVQHEKLEDYVNVDSHILCTPVSYTYANDLFTISCRTTTRLSVPVVD